jgi:iron(III) transport system substrate-binding protein
MGRVSGRARVVVVQTEVLGDESCPSSILDFHRPRVERQIGWAPTNGSFQAFVTALR